MRGSSLVMDAIDETCHIPESCLNGCYTVFFSAIKAIQFRVPDMYIVVSFGYLVRT